MAHKPRKKRLPPDKVRERIVAEQEQWAEKQQAWVRQQEGRARDQAMSDHLVRLLERLHAGVQAAAETDALYRPLIGANWYETMGLFNAYIAPLREAGQSARLREVMQTVGMMDNEPLGAAFALIGHVLTPDRSKCQLTKEPAPKSKPEAGGNNHDYCFDAGDGNAPAGAGKA